jgi:hypothetical protein
MAIKFLILTIHHSHKPSDVRPIIFFRKVQYHVDLFLVNCVENTCKAFLKFVVINKVVLED